MHTRPSLRRTGLTLPQSALFGATVLLGLLASSSAFALTNTPAEAAAQAETTPATNAPAKAADDGRSDNGGNADGSANSSATSSSNSGGASATDGSSAASSGTTRPARQRSAASAYPGYVRSMDWELDFRPGPLRLFTDVAGKNYWYFTYKVVNRTGKERMWAPRFEFFSDKGAIERSGRSVPTEVTSAILDLLRDPLLEDQNQIIGELRIGEENAKDGVVIWPADDLAVTEFTIFVTGASGKIRKVPDPRTNAPRVERWTIRFNYLVPGDPASRGSTPVDPAPTDQDVADGAQRRPNDGGVWLWR